MKITYRREMKHNYLILDPEALLWRNYECRMLSKNAINGVLPFQLRQVDDEIRFYYEITSRQPLSRMLESCPMREKEIRQLILGISGVLDRMEQYLLRENIVLLEPDYIYVEPETFRIWLCLVPGLERDFPEDYGKLLEYLLGKVDHQDKESVVLAYGLYQETRKENYGMDDILRLMTSGNEKQREHESNHGEKTQEVLLEMTKEQKETLPPLSRPKESVTLKKPFSFRDKLKSLLEKPQKSKKSEGETAGKVPWETLFCEEVQPEQAEMQHRFSVPERNCHLEQPKESGRNTTLLADFSNDNTQILRKLCALEPDLEDIVLNYYPFVIGKQKHLVDHYLNHETVSRLHVRIDQMGDGWMIQDLNSSNGTMVSGKLLENNETANLHPGDEVRIAGLRYRFE